VREVGSINIDIIAAKRRVKETAIDGYEE